MVQQTLRPYINELGFAISFMSIKFDVGVCRQRFQSVMDATLMLHCKSKKNKGKRIES